MSEDTSQHGPGRQPTADVGARVRSALARHARGDSDEDELRRTVQLFARDCRTRALRAEDAVILLKQLWRDLPLPSGVEDRRAHQRTLDRIVTICIEEFYDGATDAPD